MLSRLKPSVKGGVAAWTCFPGAASRRRGETGAYLRREREGGEGCGRESCTIQLGDGADDQGATSHACSRFPPRLPLHRPPAAPRQRTHALSHTFVLLYTPPPAHPINWAEPKRGSQLCHASAAILVRSVSVASSARGRASFFPYLSCHYFRSAANNLSETEQQHTCSVIHGTSKRGTCMSPILLSPLPPRSDAPRCTPLCDSLSPCLCMCACARTIGLHEGGGQRNRLS